MAATPKIVTVIFTSPEEVVEYHAQHLAHGGAVIEAVEVQFGQPVQVHLDMEFCGKTHIIEGTVVSATPYGTALQIPALPAEYLALLDGLQRGEVPAKEVFGGTLDPNGESDGDWVPPWDQDESASEGFSGVAEEEIDEPPESSRSGWSDGAEPSASDAAEKPAAEEEDAGFSEAPTIAVDAGDATSSEAPTIAMAGPAVDAVTSFEIKDEVEDSDEFEFDGESLSHDEASLGMLEEPIYATVQPTVQLGWAQPVAERPSDLQGKVEAKVINDVVRQLSAQRLSGVLRMKQVDRLLVGIWFQGRPLHFIVSPPEEGKGAAAALAALPEIEVAVLERAQALQQRSGGHLGIELLQMSAVTSKELAAVVRLEAQKYASTLPMRRGGIFGFWECDVPAKADGSGPDIEALLRWEASVFG